LRAASRFRLQVSRMTIQIRKLKDRRLHRVARGRLSVGASLARSTRP
jgi:hypothetical protein